jgi:fibronectin type 3 domain-containing protein
MRWLSIRLCLVIWAHVFWPSIARPQTTLPAPPRITGTAIQLQWDANSEADLAGYKVYSGVASRAYGTPTDVGNVTSYRVTALAAGILYIAVTAYNTAGAESGFSNEVTVATIPQAAITQAGVSYLTTTTAAIAWVTSVECSGVVQWGTTSLTKTSTANNLGTTDHFMLLTGLTSRTHYQYQVSGTCQGVPIQSSLRSFNTK